jgi:hypothetical protein
VTSGGRSRAWLSIATSIPGDNSGLYLLLISRAVDGGENPRINGDDRKAGTRFAACDQPLPAIYRSDANGCPVALCQRRQPPKAGAVGQRLQRVAGQPSGIRLLDAPFVRRNGVRYPGVNAPTRRAGHFPALTHVATKFGGLQPNAIEPRSSSRISPGRRYSRDGLHVASAKADLGPQSRCG